MLWTEGQHNELRLTLLLQHPHSVAVALGPAHPEQSGGQPGQSSQQEPHEEGDGDGRSEDVTGIVLLGDPLDIIQRLNFKQEKCKITKHAER